MSAAHRAYVICCVWSICHGAHMSCRMLAAHMSALTQIRVRVSDAVCIGDASTAALWSLCKHPHVCVIVMTRVCVWAGQGQESMLDVWI